MSRLRRGMPIGVGALCAATMLAGCGAGLGAATTREHTSVQGVQASADQIELRDVYIEPSSAAAPSATPTPERATPGHARVSPSPTGTPSSATGGVRSGYLVAVIVNTSDTGVSLTGVSLADGASVAPPSTGLTVPPSGLARFVDPTTGESGPTLVITGADRPLIDGYLIQVKFYFSNGVEMTVAAPVYVNHASTAITSPIPSA